MHEQESLLKYPPEHWRMLDAHDVTEWKVSPLKWIVEKVIAVGTLTLIAAPTQTGKTLLGLYMASMITLGGKLFEKYEVTPVDKVLYLVLEDPDRRIKERLLDMDLKIKEPGRFKVHIAPGFNLNDVQFSDYLEELIAPKADEEDSTDTDYDVVFLDTYQRATPGLTSYRDEEQSPILHNLSNLTRKYNKTLIVLDHVRKSDNQRQRKSIQIDDIKGTGGKAQNADAVILLEKHGDEISFRSFSKDSDQQLGILLNVSPQGSGEEKFTYAGELEDSAKHKDHTRSKILQAIKAGEKVSSGELAKRTKLSTATVPRYLNELVAEGVLRKEGKGRWTRYFRKSVMLLSKAQGKNDALSNRDGRPSKSISYIDHLGNDVWKNANTTRQGGELQGSRPCREEVLSINHILPL